MDQFTEKIGDEIRSIWRCRGEDGDVVVRINGGAESVR